MTRKKHVPAFLRIMFVVCTRNIDVEIQNTFCDFISSLILGSPADVHKIKIKTEVVDKVTPFISSTEET